jgi:hypothetical protein
MKANSFEKFMQDYMARENAEFSSNLHKKMSGIFEKAIFDGLVDSGQFESEYFLKPYEMIKDFYSIKAKEIFLKLESLNRQKNKKDLQIYEVNIIRSAENMIRYCTKEFDRDHFRNRPVTYSNKIKIENIKISTINKLKQTINIYKGEAQCFIDSAEIKEARKSNILQFVAVFISIIAIMVAIFKQFIGGILKC